MSVATDELTLLERVFLRIGSADSDEQLQNAISKFLPPVLLKLSSQQEGVRKKVMELLVHINKRLKSRPNVQLPVESLLLQYEDPSASSFIINFTIIYIKIGFPRLPLEKQAELMPVVLNALDGKPESHQDSLLFLLMPVLGNVKIPNNPEKRSSMYGLNDRPKISKLLSDFMLDVLLLPYGATPQQTDVNLPEVPGSSGVPAPFPVPPGLSEHSFKRVTGDNPLKPEDLEQVKLGIVKFLASGILQDSEILIHLIVAAADTRFNVANFADMELKKIVNSLDWSSYQLVAPLYRVFLGTERIQKSETPKTEQRTPAQKNIRTPASTRIRLKLLTYLPLSRQYDYMLAQPIQVIFESLFGNNTNPRLKVLALQFAVQVINSANISRLKTVAGILQSGMARLINDSEPSLKRLAYTAIGKLAHRVPRLVNRDLALIQTFFDSLHTEGPDIKLSIREALLSMAPAFSYEMEGEAKTTDNVRGLMVALLASQIESPEPMARFIAVRFCATVFPSTHIPSRYLLLLASGDNKDEVVTEATKALYGTNRRHIQGLELSNLSLPSFIEMSIYLEEKANARLANPMQRFTVNNKILPFSVTTFTEMVTYLRICLTKSSGAISISGSQGDPLPEKMTPTVALYIRQLHSSAEGNNALRLYLSFSEKLLMATQSIISLLVILEVVGCVPDLVAHSFVDKLSWIKVLVSSTKEEVRELAAILYGLIIASALPETTYTDAVKELCQSSTDKNFETKHGSILALAHTLESKLIYLKKENPHVDITQWTLYKDAVESILTALNSQQIQILNASCFALGLIAKRASLPLNNENSPQQDNQNVSKLEIVKKFQEMINSPKTNVKTRELAAKTIGLLCVGENFPYTKEIIQGFLKMAKETKDVEVQLTCGESLVLCVEAQRSPVARDAWRISETEWLNTRPPPNTFQLEILAALLDHLLDELVPQPHPNSRQASCIWLLALLKYCSSYSTLIDRLQRIQRAFMDLLAENNDIVQDAASKGLSLVYEASNADLRTTLVNGLLDQLVVGRRQVNQVTSDTKIFEEDALGKTPTGSNLSTYKELCSFASDLNQPDLIYKFMHLANHNAMWNSKKGAAFGFSSIAQSAGEQLTQYLPKIIPRLYRYQFDPTPKIQNSMSSIWHALVNETQKTLDTYHKEILEELAKHLTANEWRVRTSCCAALSDLLKSGGQRSLTDPNVLPIVPQLWTQLFRVMDDVHEGTRKAAEATCQVLSKVCLRYCDPTHGANSSEQMLHAIIPILLETGITNTVPKVRSISLLTISQLVGVSGKLLQPHIHLLVPALLEATGELESAKLSHLSTMYSADQSTQEAIDVARASAAKSHYTTETVSKCMQYIHANNLELLIPKVLELMRNSVGLGSKIACAHFIGLLTHHMKQDLTPYTGKLLAALVNGLTDRNIAIRRNYASTIGQLVSTAKDSSLEKLFAKINTWYFEKEDEITRSSCAYTLRAIAENNQDILREYAAHVAPLAFLALHEGKKVSSSSSVGINSSETSNADLWSEVWEEITHNTDSSFRLHGEEIVSILERAIDSASWTMKAQAAAAIATIAKKMGDSLQPHLRNKLLQLLLKSLVGRTWKGKEQLLLALATISTSCKKDLSAPENLDINKKIVDALLHECRKDQLAYKNYALLSLGDVLSALNIDCFAEVYTLVQDALSKNLDESESDKETIDAFNQLKGTVYEVLGKAWPSEHKTQVLYRERVLEQCVTCLEQSTRQVQVSVVVALRSYVDKLTLLQMQGQMEIEEIRALERILNEIIKALHFALGISKHTSLRKEALNVLFLLITKLKESKQQKYIDQLSKSFDKRLEDLYIDTSPEIKSRLIDIKDLLKS